MRDPRYDILFEPVQIGPVTTKNRFYVVPHATAMGMTALEEMIAFRKARAEGGWGVVCLEETMIHETSDHAPLPDPRMYSDKYIEPLARVGKLSRTRPRESSPLGPNHPQTSAKHHHFLIWTP